MNKFLSITFIAISISTMAQTNIFTKKILFVLTSNNKYGDSNNGKMTGYTISEAARPWKVFTENGYEIDYASPLGGLPPIHPSTKDTNDTDVLAFQKNKIVQTKLQKTLKPSEVDWKKYDVIYFVGGHGTMWDFPENAELQKITALMYENGKIVSGLCHGTVALANVKLSNGKNLIEGKKISAFSNNEEIEIQLDKVMPFLPENKVKENGGIYIPAPNWAYNVVVDGNIVTGQNPESAKGIAQEIIKVIEKNKLNNKIKMTESEMKQVIKNEFKYYNKQDFVEMRKLFSDDFKSYNFPDETIRTSNPDDLMKRYIGLFSEFPKNHAEILDIIIMGNKAFVKEKVTGRKETIILTVIFEIENFKITKNWLIFENK